MGSIDIIEHLSTFFYASPDDELLQLRIKFWDYQLLTRGLLGEKRECYLNAKQPP